MADKTIRVVIILGSVQKGCKSGMAGKLVEEQLRGMPEIEVDVIDPMNLDLSLPGRPETPDAQRIRDLVGAATGIVLVTPEYHGSYSSVTKLIIDNLGYPSVLEGKPVALLGVAAGAIGAIKALEHLRSVCSHVGAVVLPAPVSVPKVHLVFDEDGNCIDEELGQRIRGGGIRLVAYIHDHICPKAALEKMVRE